MSTEPDPREPEWKRQREERGFDDRELWSLDVTLAKFLVPRLKAFREVAPHSDEMLADIDTMIRGFSMVGDVEDGGHEFYYMEVPPETSEALAVLSRNFHQLWW